jgi:hypothetical protein
MMSKQKSTIFILIILSFFASNLTAQIYGCTDQKANNYNVAATDNDGSCTYSLTIYNPPVKYLLPDEIDETSGLAYFNGSLWTINDSGGLATLYAFDTISGEISQRIAITNATNVDWESLADDDDYIYIGDFGNNSGNRDNLAIYRVLKSDIPMEGNGNVESEKITFAYSDYKGNVEKKMSHNFDCEAFIATDDSLYLFSKNHENQKTKLYKLPNEPGNYIAEIITTFNSAGLITGADINSENNEVTLVGYVNNEWTPFTWLLFDFEDNNFFSGNKRRIDLLNIIATQTEAIAYTIDKNEVMTSEGRFFSQTAYDFNSGLWTNESPSEILEVDSDLFNFTLSPNPVAKSKLNIEIVSLPVGVYQIEVYNSIGQLVKGSSYKVTKKGGATKIKIRVGDYPDGTYFVRMISGYQVVEKKFIKRKK